MKTNLLPLAIAALIVLPAQAGPRSSASYSISAETADGGGRKTSSASYSNDGSIGGIAGIGTVVACLTHIKKAGGDLRMAGANARVLRLFQMTGVDQLLSLYPTVAEAAF